MKGKIKNSKLLAKVKQFAPHVLDLVGDVLPDKGGLGIVKNLIQQDNTITPENKADILNAYKEDLLAFELEVKDRDSARTREVELAKVKGTDWMMYLTGIIGLLAFCVTIYAVIWVPGMSENKLFIHLLGMIEGVVVTSLFGYYFGTSVDKGS
jgi:hypothetical protein